MSVQEDGHFRFVVEHAPDGVVLVVDGKIAFANPTACALLGADRATVVGTAITDYLHPAEAARARTRMHAIMENGTLATTEYVGVRPDQFIEVSSMPCTWEGRAAILGFARDVTERKRVQTQLEAADRYAALGKLAAGVAHEINNPLAYALSNLEVIEHRLRELNIADLDGQIADATHGLQRIAAITGDLRRFAQPSSPQRGPVDLAAAVEQALRVVDPELRHRARVTRDFAANLPPVLGSLGRLEQVFVNVLLNAAQALRAPASDEITIQLTYADRHAIARVIDTGHGIPSKIRGRVFDPFFTTRPSGSAMGLGLTVCKNLVESDGGTIDLASSTTGTVVTLTFPLAAATTAAPVQPQPAVPPLPTVSRQRVLLVDDEPYIRETLSVLLGMFHDVETAESGAVALRKLEQGSFDIVVCDLMMPNMTGKDVYDAVAQRRPGFERRFIFVTGGAYAPELAEFVATCGNRCLTKPFKIEVVLDAIAATVTPAPTGGSPARP